MIGRRAKMGGKDVHRAIIENRKAKSIDKEGRRAKLKARKAVRLELKLENRRGKMQRNKISGLRRQYLECCTRPARI